MSQFAPALAYVLNWEDPEHAYEEVPDVGGNAISGINSAEWPNWFSKVQQVPQQQRASIVASFYKTNFWDVMQIGGLVSQDLANRVMDSGVNTGSGEGIKLLQKACLLLGSIITVDGVMGPITMETANGYDSDRIVGALRQVRINFYNDLVSEKSEDKPYLAEWLRRASA